MFDHPAASSSAKESAVPLSLPRLNRSKSLRPARAEGI
jgi:hypothetical protein